ncbi:MAG: PBECR4 domain-containing protein [Lachnospiraceae bacterium]
MYQAASVWKELTEFHYIFTYGHKKQLFTIHLTFSLGEFPHLAGFQYLQDIPIPRYNSEKIVSRILDGHLTLTQIKANYLISSHSPKTNYVFIIQNQSYETDGCNYLCCSAFKQGERNYEINQSSRTLLKKERLHIPSHTSVILLDKLQ